MAMQKPTRSKAKKGETTSSAGGFFRPRHYPQFRSPFGLIADGASAFRPLAVRWLSAGCPEVSATVDRTRK
jgi:hypothetical protein